MDDDDEKLRKAGALAAELGSVPLAATSPLSFGRKLLELLVRAYRKEPIPGLPEYMLDWLNDIALDLRAHDERLLALESDPGRTMVLGNYGLEAWREAVDRRRSATPRSPPSSPSSARPSSRASSARSACSIPRISISSLHCVIRSQVGVPRCSSMGISREPLLSHPDACTVSVLLPPRTTASLRRSRRSARWSCGSWGARLADDPAPRGALSVKVPESAGLALRGSRTQARVREQRATPTATSGRASGALLPLPALPGMVALPAWASEGMAVATLAQALAAVGEAHVPRGRSWVGRSPCLVKVPGEPRTINTCAARALATAELAAKGAELRPGSRARRSCTSSMHKLQDCGL